MARSTHDARLLALLISFVGCSTDGESPSAVEAGTASGGTPARGSGGVPVTTGGSAPVDTGGRQPSNGGTTLTSGGSGGVHPGTGGDATDGGSAGGSDAGTIAPGSADEGDVRIVKRMGDPSFDAVVTQPPPETVKWLTDHFYRMEVFTTFFDDKTSFYPEGWVYSDSEVIYPGSTTAKNHPDWILADGQGHAVYLDWNCANGTCPQYAADVTNAEFRAAWIGSLKAALAKGYRGAWIDDVNLALRFSDGRNAVTARSPKTNTVMTEDVWSAAVAAFMTEVRAALPSFELLHNSIWYARPGRTSDAAVSEQIRAADVINMEGGFASDGGLTGGTGEWSVSAKMAFADSVHAAGRWVVVDDFPSTDVEREYALACYLLLSDGKDALGDAAMSPSTWWKGYDIHLGKALGTRARESSGLFRRTFEHGVVLMLEPSATSQTIALPGSHLTIDGKEVTSLTLSAKRGAVLVTKE